MPKWNEFVPLEIEYDFEKDKLYAQKVTIEEAAQCFFNQFTVIRNKRYKDRYKLRGTTDACRNLSIIFQLKRKNAVRIITGWEE